MSHRQTVSVRASAAWTNILRDRNDTVWTLGSLIASGEDRVRKWELEPLPAAGQACCALWNGVESGHDRWVSGRLAALAKLAGILATACSRWRGVSQSLYLTLTGYSALTLIGVGFVPIGLQSGESVLYALKRPRSLVIGSCIKGVSTVLIIYRNRV